MHIVACSNKISMFEGFNWWMNEPWNEENIKKEGHCQPKFWPPKKKMKNEQEGDATGATLGSLAPLSSTPHPRAKGVRFQSQWLSKHARLRLLNMLRKPSEGPVVVLAGEGGKDLLPWKALITSKACKLAFFYRLSEIPVWLTNVTGLNIFSTSSS